MRLILMKTAKKTMRFLAPLIIIIPLLPLSTLKDKDVTYVIQIIVSLPVYSVLLI